MKLINHTLQKSYVIWNGIIVGRNQGGILFPKSKEMSAQHFRIHIVDGKFLIEDLGTKNGTSVGGSLLRGHKPTPVSAEEVFQAGEYDFSLTEHEVTLPGDTEDDSKPWIRNVFLAVSLIVLFISWSSYELSRYLNEFVPAWVGWMASLTSLGALILSVSVGVSYSRRKLSWIEKLFFATGIHLVITLGLFAYESNHFSSQSLGSAKLPLIFSKPLIAYFENNGTLSLKYALTVAFDLARIKRVKRNFHGARGELCKDGLKVTDCWMREITQIHTAAPWSVPALGHATAVLNDLDHDLPQDQVLLENRFKNWIALGDLLLTSMDVKWLENLRAISNAPADEKKLLSLHLLENIKYFQFQLLTEIDLLEAQVKQSPSPQMAAAFTTYAVLKQKIGWPNPQFENEIKEIRKALEKQSQ